MKRGLIILFLFIFLLGLSLVEELYLKTNLELLNKKSINLLTIVENSENVDNEEIKNEIINLKEFWDKTEGIFCIVVNHVNMEEAGEQIAKITALASLNKKEELIVEINLLIFYSESYQHIIVPHIQNIL